MNSFGLGLILNFVDNASAGMDSATRSFMAMSATADSMTSSVGMSANSLASIAFSLGAVGDTFASIGQSITGVFLNATQSVINTGMTVQGYRSQLNALYGSAEAGEAKLEEIKKYAAESVFEIESLIPAVTMMKAVGIEAMEEVTTSSGNATQKLLDYASDIAAMIPNMHNAYGTGVQAAMGAMKEYIAEGNARSLKSGAGLDITQILGEDKGSTIEERTQQIADLVEKLNIVGYTASLAGTPTQRLSNIQDTLFNTMAKIADSGVISVYCSILEKLSDWIFKTADNEETFNTITQLLADTMTTLLTPISKAVDLVVKYGDAVINWVKENPKLAKGILLVIAAVGGALVVGGKFLKLMSSVTTGALGVKMLLDKLPISLGTLGKGFGGVMSKALPFVALASILYFAWKNNIFGIRDVITNAFKDIKQIFSLVKEAWSEGELSVESFQLANKLGILPLISSLLQLKYYWTYFKEGFSEGFKSFFDAIANSLSFLKIFGIDINSIAKSLGEFLKKLIDVGQEDKWQKIGKAVGVIAGVALSIFSVYKALSAIKSISSGIKSVPLLGGLFGKGGAASSAGSESGGLTSGGLLSNPTKVLKSMASIAIILGGVVLLITALGALQSLPGFSTLLSNGFAVVTEIFKNLIPLAASVAVLSLLVVGLDKISNPKNVALGLADLAIILGGFEVLIIAMGALSSIPGFSNFISKGAETLGALCEAMKPLVSFGFVTLLASIVALGFIGPQTVALGLAGLAIIIAGFALIVSAFAALSLIDGFDEFLKSGGRTLSILFEQVGHIVGSLVAGFAEGVTSSFPVIASNLSAFAANITPFFDMCKDAPIKEIGEFMLAFAGAMLLLSGEELLSIFTGGIDFAGLGVQLSAFSVTSKTFFDTVSSYSQEGIEKSKLVFEALASIGKYSFRSGGVAQFFTGEVNLEAIGTQLASFAPNGLTYFNTVAQYDEAGLEKSPKVFESLAGIGAYEFKSGGVAQFFTGETAIDIIGAQLASFAPNGLTYFNTVAQYDDAGLEKSPKVFKSLAGIGDYDFKSGGVAQFFTGETSLDKIGVQLSKFAPNGKTYFDAVADYPEKGIENSKKVFESLSAIGAYEFKTGGLAQLFTGSTDLGDMGKQLSKFAKKSKDFFETMGELSESSISKGAKAIDILSVIGSSGLTTGGLFSLFTGSIDISSVGEQLSTFGDKAKNYFIAMSGVTETSISRGSQALAVLSELGNYTFRSGGLFQVFTGTVNITNLTDNLSKFGTGSASFFKGVGTLSNSSFTKASAMFKALSDMSLITDILPTLGDEALSRFGEDLVTFIDSCKSFFEKAGSFNTDSLVAVTESLSPFFDTVTAFDSSKLDTIVKGLNDTNTAVFDLSSTVSTASSDIKRDTETIISSIGTCTNECLTSLNEFSEKGVSIGATLMQNIASGISANAYLITNAVQRAVDSITISVPNIATSAASQVGAKGGPAYVGLATGGYVKETGIAVLHPNEVVVNDSITKKLESFLNGFDLNKDSSVSSVGYQNPSSSGNTSIDSSTINNYNILREESPVSQSSNSYDNSVTFEAGSVVLQLSGVSEGELEKAADKLMKIIARKQQLKAMVMR